MRTDELIVQLAGAAGPAPPLSPPFVRLTRWLAMVLPITALGVLLIHPRADVLVALRDPSFVARGVATLATALLSAAGAFVLSIPGAERSRLQRGLPLLAAVLWVCVLVAVLVRGGSSVARLAAFPVNPLCVYQIVGLSLVPALTLFVMLRRAAPLQIGWSAVLATLASVALSAAGTQFICPVDDPAHQLVGHVLPVIVFTIIGAAVGRRPLDWLAAIRPA